MEGVGAGKPDRSPPAFLPSCLLPPPLLLSAAVLQRQRSSSSSSSSSGLSCRARPPSSTLACCSRLGEQHGGERRSGGRQARWPRCLEPRASRRPPRRRRQPPQRQQQRPQQQRSSGGGGGDKQQQQQRRRRQAASSTARSSSTTCPRRCAPCRRAAGHRRAARARARRRAQAAPGGPRPTRARTAEAMVHKETGAGVSTRGRFMDAAMKARCSGSRRRPAALPPRRGVRPQVPGGRAEQDRGADQRPAASVRAHAGCGRPSSCRMAWSAESHTLARRATTATTSACKRHRRRQGQ